MLSSTQKTRRTFPVLFCCFRVWPSCIIWAIIPLIRLKGLSTKHSACWVKASKLSFSHSSTPLSLSEQITSLVKCAHIFCALFRQHTTSFMSNQLYGDIQCTIKNAIFHVAKTRDLDSTLGVFTCLLGDDVLETLFGHVCMIGGHSPNIDIGEMEAWCRSALILDDIYARNWTWEHVKERLKLWRNRDYNHLKPRDWKGDVIAGNCNLQVCWDKGFQEAINTLRHF